MYGAARDVTERHIATKELSALRHVATLAAEGVVPTDLFAVVAEEVARVVTSRLSQWCATSSTTRSRCAPHFPRN
jgi:hypothetical protein